MTQGSISSASSIHFIGREDLLRAICSEISRLQRRQIISIHGEGGVGKTYLLRKIEELYANQDGFVCFPLINFSQNEARTLTWLIPALANGKPPAFANYLKENREYEENRSSAGGAIWSQEQLVKNFTDDFVKLESETRCIFLFDTLELIQDTFLLDFLFKLADASRNSVFIFAGRRNKELEVALNERFKANVTPHDIGGFTLQDAMQYIQQNSAVELDEQEQQTLYYLADKGIPIKLALTLDWLARGLTLQTLIDTCATYSIDQLSRLESDDPRAYWKLIMDFERELVTQIAELGNDVDRTIYVMAHVHKRFNRELLALLIPHAAIEDVVNRLRELEFIKFIEDDYFILHDEVQRMIIQHVWDGGHDPVGTERKEISHKVIGYYTRKIQELDEKLADHHDAKQERERYIFEVEQLHYWLNISLIEDGYPRFTGLFEELEDKRQIELAALALDVLLKSGPLPERLRLFVTTYYQGWVYIRRNEYLKAQTCIENGIDRLLTRTSNTNFLYTPEEQVFLTSEVEDRLGELYTQLGYCLRLMGYWQQATEQYEKGCSFNRDKIDEQAAQNNDDQKRKFIKRLAESLNDLANLERLQGELERARIHCKTSLLIRRSLGDDQKRGVGHCLYVMAMIMWETGNTSEAMNYIQKAREAYQSVNEERLQRAWLDRYEAYMMYRTGNPEQAIRLIQSAQNVTGADPALRDEHAETKLYLSRIYREQGKLDAAWEQAWDALKIAQEMGNDYRVAEGYLSLSYVLSEYLDQEPQHHEYHNHFEEYVQKGLEIANRRQYFRLEVVFWLLQADQNFKETKYAKAFQGYAEACRQATKFKPAVFVRASSQLAHRLYQLNQIDSFEAARIGQHIVSEWKNNPELASDFPGLMKDLEHIVESAQHNTRRRALEIKYDNHYRHGEWEEALQVCDELDSIPLDDHLEQAYVLFWRANVSHSQSNFAVARRQCEQAIRILETLGTDPIALGRCYQLLSLIFWKLGNTAEAADFLNRAHECFSRQNDQLGLGLVAYDQAYIFFRTRQFSEARERLALAQAVFDQIDNSVQLARTLNLFSWIERAEDHKEQEKEGVFFQAHHRGELALNTLDNRDWFVASEIYLTLSILHFTWGEYLQKQERLEEAQEHFGLSWDYNDRGMTVMEQIASPTLDSIYSGIRGNLFLKSGDYDSARKSFLDELRYATETKPMRLLRALDLLEDWLASLPVSETQEHGQWLIDNWQKEAHLAEDHAQVKEALSFLISHCPYILDNTTYS